MQFWPFSNSFQKLLYIPFCFFCFCEWSGKIRFEIQIFSKKTFVFDSSFFINMFFLETGTIEAPIGFYDSVRDF